MDKKIEFCPFCEDKEFTQVKGNKYHCDNCNVDFTDKDCSFDKDGKQMQQKDMEKYTLVVEIVSTQEATIKATSKEEAKQKLQTLIKQLGYIPEDLLSGSLSGGVDSKEELRITDVVKG